MKVNIFYVIAAALVVFFVVKQCEQEPKIKTVTKIEYVKVTDIIERVKIDTVPKLVYVKKVKDSIVYVSKPSDSTIEANQYKTKIASNNATADLEITTTGELLDVRGVINYTQENKATTITKVKPKSGLFLYGATSVNPTFENIELGLDYQIKNTIVIGTSVNYNNQSKSAYINLKLGFRVF